MNNYDFLTLSPNEFENLTRDLLQKKLNVFIESFTSGRDGGIDLRCAKDKTKTIIIQAKRYKDLNSLLSNLKKEIKKINDLKPNKYIISTSVGLTPSNKTDILNLFSPYIKTTSDILGKDDLNNLLGLNQDIELKYYKLWLSSTNVLNKILHSKVYNQSAFELEEIREQVRLYVQNDSFNIGIKILKEHKYVIISGIPGIGKTTLARVLSFYLLSNDFDEFVYLGDSIDNGYELFEEGKKQIFFFDDFLGKNFFEGKLHPNADSKIVKFIEKIKKSHNKLLILATREYILNQAKQSYESFKINNIEIAKCILDLDSYTNIIKAQILYNHLFFADVPQAHLADLIGSQKHLSIVKHRNYNPRIIETIINRKIWESCEATQFSNVIKSYFDNPESVWLYAFENSLDKFSQYTLLVLLTMGASVKIHDLEDALISFLKINQYKFQIAFDSIIFIRSIKELENTFIRTQKDSYDTIAIQYQNPSIQDFLVNYLRDKTDLIKCLQEGAIFQEQFFSVFVTSAEDEYTIAKKILLNEELCDFTFNQIKTRYSNLKRCRVFRVSYTNNENFIWVVDEHTTYQFLNQIRNQFRIYNIDVISFIKEKFIDLIYLDEASYSEQYAYLEILKELDLKELEFTEKKLIDSFLNKIWWLNNLELFSKLEELFPSTYKDSITDISFEEKIGKLVKEGIKKVDESEMDSLKGQIESIGLKYSLDLDEYVVELAKKINDYDDYTDSQINSYLEDGVDRSEDERSNEVVLIEEIFNSLADQ